MSEELEKTRTMLLQYPELFKKKRKSRNVPPESLLSDKDKVAALSLTTIFNDIVTKKNLLFSSIGVVATTLVITIGSSKMKIKVAKP